MFCDEPETLPIRSDNEQLRRYRESAKLLRELREEPDDCDWDLIEAEINCAGMGCREPELSQFLSDESTI